MKRVVTASLMKALDGNTIERHRVPSMVLMERAALAVVDALSGWNLEKVLVVCGNGNNGGDGIAAARILKGKGYSVHICQPGADRRKSADCVRQEEIARSYDVTWVNNPNWSEYTTIVDAIFGVGLSRNIEGIFAETIQKINESGVPVMAVDVPSGIDSDTGQILGCAVRARETVTFAFAKAGQLLEPGYGYCGRLKICDIGIYDSEHLEKEDTFFIEEKDMEQIPLRREDGNKGSFGKILLAAGSTGMAGAAYLCGLAAMRTGCGMVKIVTPAENRDILQKRIPEAMLSVYETEQEAEQCILEGLKWADTAGIGPGLGQDKRAETMIRTILKNCDHPLVVDADALNLISAHKEWLDDLKCPAVITSSGGNGAAHELQSFPYKIVCAGHSQSICRRSQTAVCFKGFQNMCGAAGRHGVYQSYRKQRNGHSRLRGCTLRNHSWPACPENAICIRRSHRRLAARKTGRSMQQQDRTGFCDGR